MTQIVDAPARETGMDEEAPPRIFDVHDVTPLVFAGETVFIDAGKGIQHLPGRRREVDGLGAGLAVR